MSRQMILMLPSQRSSLSVARLSCLKPKFPKLAGGAFFLIRQGIGLRFTPVCGMKPEVCDSLPGILSALRVKRGYLFSFSACNNNRYQSHNNNTELSMIG